MLEKYSAGTSIVALAREYNCDHTSIIFHAKRAGIFFPKSLRKPVIPVAQRPKEWDNLHTQWICCGSKLFGRHKNACAGLERPQRRIPKVSKYQHVFEEKVSAGRTYQEYLDREAEKKMLRLKCASKASVYGVPKPVVDSLPFNFRHTGAAESSRNTDDNKSIGWRGQRAIFATSQEEPSQDLVVDLLSEEEN